MTHLSHGFRAIEKSIQINRQIYGEVSAKVANSYDSLGEVYLNAGLYKEAIEQYEKAIRYFIELFGEEHPGVQTARNGIKLAQDQLQ
ncbi:MAG: tetratricopeptide repeat protein [Reinekea sp.]